MFCPICSSLAATTEPVTRDEKSRLNTYYIGWCAACDARFDQRIFSVDETENLAIQTLVKHEPYKPGFIEREYETQLAINGGMIEAYVRFCQIRDVYVEIGVGLGMLTRAAAPSFGRAYGLDLDVEFAESAGPKPPNLEFWCHQEFLDNVSSDISALCAWHVVEHLHNPHGVLKPLFKRMPFSSIFFGQVPLFKFELVRNDHFVWYTEKSLIRLTEAYGFYPIYFERDEVNDFLSFCFRRR
jgi:hypothetical protein